MEFTVSAVTNMISMVLVNVKWFVEVTHHRPVEMRRITLSIQVKRTERDLLFC